jgi:ParB-like chromosome segregation protein Spo0J
MLKVPVLSRAKETRSGSDQTVRQSMAASAPKITDETRKVSELRPDPKNPKTHSERQISDIVQSIEAFGYVNKIAIKPDGMIIGGHGTLDAIKRLGWDKVDVRVVAGLTPAAYRKLNIALNKLPEGSKWDERLLSEIIQELDAAGEGDDLVNIGFGEKELAGLRAGDDPLEVKEIETGDVEDEFWISIRGPLAAQADVLKAMEGAMKPFEGVSVELGTIGLK